MVANSNTASATDTLGSFCGNLMCLDFGVMELIVLGFVIDENRIGRLGGIERSSGRLGRKESAAFSV